MDVVVLPLSSILVGHQETEEVVDTLSHNGKKVLTAIAPPFGEFTCYAPWSLHNRAVMLTVKFIHHGGKSMSLRITTLSEDTAGVASFLAEWGLSVLVETEKTAVLLDAGEAISAAHNVDALRIDLNRIDRTVLSHGHHDHTGGLRQLLQEMRKEVEIIAHPDIWQAKYALRALPAPR